MAFEETITVDLTTQEGMSLRDMVAAAPTGEMIDYVPPAGTCLRLTGVVNFKIIPIEETP